MDMHPTVPSRNQETNNNIDPSARISADVKIGKGNVIGAYTVITGDVTIGDNNWIGSHVVIGSPPQFATKKFEFTGQGTGGVRIGNRNVLREYASVNQPSEFSTVIEDDCYIMAYSHISHDSRIGRSVTLAMNVQIGGFSEIQPAANVGIGAITHQFTTIGSCAMIGMGAVVNKDVPPFLTVAGVPVRAIGINRTGMLRNGFADAQVQAVITAYKKGNLSGHVDPSVDDLSRLFINRNMETKRPVVALTFPE